MSKHFNGAPSAAQSIGAAIECQTDPLRLRLEAAATAQELHDRATLAGSGGKFLARPLTAGDYADVFLVPTITLPDPAPGYEYAVIVLKGCGMRLFVEVPWALAHRLPEMDDQEIIDGQMGQVKQALQLIADNKLDDALYLICTGRTLEEAGWL
jgi:hypothetical protein